VRLDQARRVAILRGGGLGDLLFTLPAVEALRAAAPAAEIRLLGTGALAELVEGRPAVPDGPSLVDQVCSLPPEIVHRLGTGEPDTSGTGDAFVRSVAAWSPDVAIQLHGGGGHSNAFLAELGAALTAGTRTPEAAPLDRWIPYIYYQPEVFRWLEVVGLLDAEPVSLEPRLALTPAERARGAGHRPDSGRPLAVIHPGATDPRRRWPAASFAALADRLVDAGTDVAVVGAGDDRAAADRILEAADRPVLDLVGRLRLVELAGVLAEAAVVIGNDSGPVHLARAVGAPTVAIYWFGNLVNGGPPWRARHRPAVAWRLQCPVCGLDCMALRPR
jgi:ADP-heptose:LPS heptosyltransferase